MNLSKMNTLWHHQRPLSGRFFLVFCRFSLFLLRSISSANSVFKIEGDIQLTYIVHGISLPVLIVQDVEAPKSNLAVGYAQVAAVRTDV